MMDVLGHLDPTSDRAPFRQIADQLRDFTLHLTPGGRLPSEAELMTHYGVARMTVRSAVQELVREGLVEARQGAGVFRRDGDGLAQAAADMAHRDDLARDVARMWVAAKAAASTADDVSQRRRGIELEAALDLLAAAYGEGA